MNEQGWQSLNTRARFLTVLLPAFAAVRVLIALLEIAGVVNFTQEDGSNVSAIAAVGLLALFIVCAVFTGMWLSRANSNLREASIEMAFSPRGTWGWYFVPVANLFKPFEAMREIWNESLRAHSSFGSEDHSLLRIWWGCWIVGSIISNVTARIEAIAASSFGVVLSSLEAVAFAGAALMLLRIVREVTAAQADLGKASVFA